MPLTNEQLAAIHAAKKAGLTKKEMFQADVERKKLEREGGIFFMGEFIPTESPGKIPFPTYVKIVRARQKDIHRVFPKKSKTIADKILLEEIMLRDPELKKAFLKEPRITEKELESLK